MMFSYRSSASSLKTVTLSFCLGTMLYFITSPVYYYSFSTSNNANLDLFKTLGVFLVSISLLMYGASTDWSMTLYGLMYKQELHLAKSFLLPWFYILDFLACFLTPILYYILNNGHIYINDGSDDTPVPSISSENSEAEYPLNGVVAWFNMVAFFGLLSSTLSYFLGYKSIYQDQQYSE